MSISDKAKNHQVTRQHGGNFTVISAGSGTKYSVTITPPYCNCKGFQYRGRCSHVEAAQAEAELVSAAIWQEAKDGGYDNVTDYVNDVLFGVSS